MVEEVSDRDVRLPDERPRLRADGRPAGSRWLRARRGRRGDRRRRRHQHLQRAREGRGEALHAPRRDPRESAEHGPSPGRRGRRLRRAAGGRRDPQALEAGRRHRRHAGGEAAAGLVARAEGGTRAARRSQSARGRVVPLRPHPPRRSGPGLRHHHRGLQRVLRFCVVPYTRGTSACGRSPKSCPRRATPPRPAAAKSSCSARSSITTRRPTRRATSRGCSSS